MLDPTFLRPIAHRGLHDRARGVIENTWPAFAAAIERGYGVECDLRPGRGGLPLVFHDETLERLVQGSGPVSVLAPSCAAKLRFLEGGVTGILTFQDLLQRVDARVPLLVEVKSEWSVPDEAFLAEIARPAGDYRGSLALMSFDPAVMVRLRALAPQVPRGIVSGSYRAADGESWWPGQLSDARRDALASLAESEPVAPDFYAYQVSALPTAATQQVRAAGLPVFAWTVRSAHDRDLAALHADAPIFEGYVA